MVDLSSDGCSWPLNVMLEKLPSSLVRGARRNKVGFSWDAHSHGHLCATAGCCEAGCACSLLEDIKYSSGDKIESESCTDWGSCGIFGVCVPGEGDACAAGGLWAAHLLSLLSHLALARMD